MLDEAQPSFGFFSRQFRIFSWNLCETVMCEVKIFKPCGWQEKQKTTHPRRHTIQPRGSKRRLMHGFMQKCKQKNDRNTLWYQQQLPKG